MTASKARSLAKQNRRIGKKRCQCIKEPHLTRQLREQDTLGTQMHQDPVEVLASKERPVTGVGKEPRVSKLGYRSTFKWVLIKPQKAKAK